MEEGAPGETTLPVYQGKDFRSGGRSSGQEADLAFVTPHLDCSALWTVI